jgi:hypothetical protein
MTPQRFEGVTLQFAADFDLVSAALAMLAHGLSELPARQRDAKLEQLEDGALRAAVLRLVAHRMTTQPQSSPWPITH